MSFWRNLIRWFAKKSNPKREAQENAWAFGLNPSPEDARDNLYAIPDIPVGASLPESVTLEEWAQPVKNQGWIGSCASHAICDSMELWVAKNKGKDRAVQLSELFHYYIVRQKDYQNTFPKDSGQFIRNGMKAAQKVGVSPEMLCPYQVSKYNVTPGWAAYSFSKFFTIKSYHRCWSTSAMRSALAGGLPVVVGLDWYFDDTPYGIGGKTGELRGTGTAVGGHALLVVGYDDKHQNPDGSLGAFKLKNSWGESWGMKGYGWASYNLVSRNFIESFAVDVA